MKIIKELKNKLKTRNAFVSIDQINTEEHIKAEMEKVNIELY